MAVCSAELQDVGLADVIPTSGGPRVAATFRIPFALPTILDYAANEDLLQIARVVEGSDAEWLSGSDLVNETGLEPVRINHAVLMGEERVLLKVRKRAGTAPFSFGWVGSDHRSRAWLREQSGKK